ncbi:GNAT family N-acetyltransferase [Iningainema tapete]|uniref:GNAT family N-acetyltransferase n=1 Tax=Iningainema tapete BLCC-T55 TaxID=2748662 RepID=A0A8J6XW83_9CYAN|nr:GNAT family N-acetyltransferase [Iningainema tapete]MBD2777487.1 GNAT family N-acetyltransferase [Iningainema tapete BLCC-T55]
MLIRPIQREELKVFAAFSNQPERNERFLTYLTSMWDEGYIRPEWCFVAEQAGAFIGRIVYWTLPSLDNFFEVDVLEVPWNANYLEVGTKLLLDSLAQMPLPPEAIIQYTLDTPYPMSTSGISTYTEQRIEVMEKFGFSLLRETHRFEWQETQTQIALSQRLVFRTLEDVGEDVFINTLMRVSENSLDRILQQETEKLGLERYAVEKFKTLKAFKYKPTWWQLAYTQDGSVVGLIMTAENDGGPIIGYIGVIPEYRGQGYVNDLLAQGTLSLKADGALRVRADTDINNTPMILAFQRAGYKQFALRREYRLVQICVNS